MNRAHPFQFRVTGPCHPITVLIEARRLGAN